MNKYEINEWTESIVKSNEESCFEVLLEKNDEVVEFLECGEYVSAVSNLDQMINGMKTMLTAGIRDMGKFLSITTYDKGMVVLYGLDNLSEEERKKSAIECFSFVANMHGPMEEDAKGMINLLNSGASIEDTQAVGCPFFPIETSYLISDTTGKALQARTGGQKSYNSDKWAYYPSTFESPFYPSKWTAEFVKNNKTFCINVLQIADRKAIEHMRDGKYHVAIACLDQFLNGAIIIQNAGVANMRPLLSGKSFEQGVLLLYGRKDCSEDKIREMAIGSFLDSADFSNGGLKQYAEEAVRMLQSGQSLKEIREEMCPDFPEDLIGVVGNDAQRLEEMKGNAGSTSSRATSTSGKSGGCYVATCVYGSYDCPSVWTLRRFRDYSLATTWYGRAFIRTYYFISPTMVKWFGKTKWFKKLFKKPLDKMVSRLNNKGFKNTPYCEKNL